MLASVAWKFCRFRSYAAAHFAGVDLAFWKDVERLVRGSDGGVFFVYGVLRTLLRVGQLRYAMMMIAVSLSTSLFADLDTILEGINIP